jgi:signal transduction histidine kinase
VRIRLDLTDGVTVLAVPASLALVVQNLLDNVVRHAPGSSVDLGARSHDGTVEISVADRGPGVPDDQAARIFDWGVSLHPAGEGLGLHIARSLAREQGGDLRHEARPGGGSRFVLTLPDASPEARRRRLRQANRASDDRSGDRSGQQGEAAG